MHFRDIHLEKHRPVGFSIHFDHDHWSRSVYPGSVMPVQTGLTFEQVFVQNEVPVFLRSITPMDMIRVVNCELGDSRIRLEALQGEQDNYEPARMLLCGNDSAPQVECVPGRSWSPLG